MAAPIGKQPRDILSGDILTEILQEIGPCKIKEDIEHELKKSLCNTSQEETIKEDTAKRWLLWARQREHVKVVEADIPEGILPHGLTGQLYDVKVFTKRGPDDAIYDSCEDIRQKVARGNCFIDLSDEEDSEISCIIYALKKFTGGLGDDDDKDRGDNFTWKRYFTKPLQEAVSVVATRKANGEAAHLSCKKVKGRYLICAGSKNVHLVFTERAHIDKYTESRFMVAKEVAKTVMDVLERMTDDQRNRLLSYLCMSRYTAVFEILQPTHQHVEDLSYLKSSELRFIAWTSSNLEPPKETSLCSMAPHVAIEIAKALHLPTVQYEIIPAEQVEERMVQIRQGYNYEGEVLYFLDKSNSVIGLLKKKTIWYILCRAIREKVRGACQRAKHSSSTFSISDSLHKLEKRIHQIQDWLGLDPESTGTWKYLGSQFMKWCVHSVEIGEISVSEVADLFPVVWKKHLQVSGLCDKISSKWEEPEGSDD